MALPDQPSDINPTWVQQVLGEAGHDVEVTSCEVSAIGTGQMASSFRASLSYGDEPTSAPRSIVVKIASDNPSSRAAGANGAYEREVRYYQELDATVSVDTPAALWADIDTETHAFALVLEDMAPATQGDQIEGCSVEQARAAARNIAGLHAPRWCDPTLFDLDWLGVPLEQRSAVNSEAEAVMQALTPGFIERYQTSISSQEIDLLNWFAEHTAETLTHDQDCFGLGHADHRLDNLLFADRAHRPVTVVDWQTIGVRNPLCDVSYLLGTGLEPETRRLVERDIVAEYHERLVELGVTGYSVQRCFDDYRAQSLHALLITVLGSMMTGQTDRGDEMFMAMLHRSSQQIFDLDSRS